MAAIALIVLCVFFGGLIWLIAQGANSLMAADRQMFSDAIEQGLALVAPEIGSARIDQITDDLVDLIGVWEPTKPEAGLPLGHWALGKVKES